VIIAKLYRSLHLGLKSLLLHKMRSTLTAMGIIFGVGSVIAMMAINEGASREQQKIFKALGATNIIFRSAKPSAEDSTNAQQSRVLDYGLTRADLKRIVEVPTVSWVMAQRELAMEARNGARMLEVRVVGTTPDYKDFYKLLMRYGRFLVQRDARQYPTVCVLGSEVADQLFPLDDALGNTVRLQSGAYRVIGVLEPRSAQASTAVTGLTENFNRDIYIMLDTLNKRFGETYVRRTSGTFEATIVPLHQITVRVDETGEVIPTAAAIRYALERFHDKQDYSETVPLTLLRQAEEAKRISMIVFGLVAGISLLVGGIGIMNIMLATVTERTREIGIRRALGATRRDITMQFLIETLLLAGIGGLLGIGLGLVLPSLVTYYTKMPTVVTLWSLGLAYGVSFVVGVVFGLYPAQRAANMDPIEALRHE